MEFDTFDKFRTFMVAGMAGRNLHCYDTSLRQFYEYMKRNAKDGLTPESAELCKKGFWYGAHGGMQEGAVDIANSVATSEEQNYLLE